MFTSPTEIILSIFLLIPGIIAIYWPRFQLKMSDTQMITDVARLKPRLKWIVWGFPAASIAWSLILAGGMFLIAMRTGEDEIFLYIGHFAAAMGLFYGVFALITGVQVLPKRRTYPVRCVTGDRAYTTGSGQTFISIIALVLNSVLLYMFAP